MTTASFQLLHVCTGNICRSALAEHMTRAALAERLADQAGCFVVTSAGTWGHAGSPMEDHASHVLEERGLAATGFIARELSRDMVAGADLVLTASRDHRAAAVTLYPAAAARTFTLREFARLSRALTAVVPHGSDVVADARAAVALAAGRRGSLPPVPPYEDAVSDPYGAPLELFRRCAAILDDALSAALDLLVGPARRT